MPSVQPAKLKPGYVKEFEAKVKVSPCAMADCVGAEPVPPALLYETAISGVITTEPFCQTRESLVPIKTPALKVAGVLL